MKAIYLLHQARIPEQKSSSGRCFCRFSQRLIGSRASRSQHTFPAHQVRSKEMLQQEADTWGIGSPSHQPVVWETNKMEWMDGSWTTAINPDAGPNCVCQTYVLPPTCPPPGQHTHFERTTHDECFSGLLSDMHFCMIGRAR